MEVLEKHKRYLEHHVPGEVFWGLGIENETYIELQAGKEIVAEFLAKNRQRERYSVNYWTQYKDGVVDKVFREWIAKLPHGPNTPLLIPLLINGHTFTKCDPWGEHATTYSANPKPNPKYAGRTLLEALQVVDPTTFQDGSGVWWCFDGDTVEFMTQAFRCTTVEQVLAELNEAKARWLTALQTGLKTIRCEAALKGPVGWPSQNHGLAIFLSNRRNVAVFNNGTYHINITAPSRLGKDGEIEDWPRFQHIHRQAARLFQWLSPFFVASYGSGDIFSQIGGGKAFPAGSQRLAASRYVSVGTFDTRLMPRGKIVTTPTAEMVPTPAWWHEMYASRQVAYEKLESIGYDINFNKFPNHGLEFRIFDWFGEESLGELLEVLVAMMDRAMAVPRGKEVPFPQDSAVWRKVLGRTVWEGSDALVLSRELRVFAAVLGIPELQHPFYRPVLEVYEIIRKTWCKTRDGPCSSRMFQKPELPKPLHPVEPILQPMEPSQPLHLVRSLTPVLPTITSIIPISTKCAVGSSAAAAAVYIANEEIHPHHVQYTPPSPLHPIPPEHQEVVKEVVTVSQSPCCLLGFFAKRRTIQ
jgi:hypothetical protein